MFNIDFDTLNSLKNMSAMEREQFLNSLSYEEACLLVDIMFKHLGIGNMSFSESELKSVAE